MASPRVRRSCALLFWLGLMAVAAIGTRAQEALVTDRPDFTESPVSVRPGRVQLEAGYTYEEAGAIASQTFGEILLRIGLAESVELRLGANSYARESSPGGDSSGIENSFVGIKLETGRGSQEPAFLKPATALLIGTSLPTGSSEVREPHLEPGIILALDWALQDPLGIASNVGLFYASEDGEQFALGSFSTALGIDLGGSWGAFLEYFTLVPSGSDRAARHFLDAGFTYLISEDFQLDIRGGTELSGDTDYFAGIGLAYRW